LYRAQQAGSGVVKGNEKDRKTRSRARRSAMFSALREVGVVLHYDAKMAELYRLCKEHQIAIPKDAPGTGPVTPRPVTGHGNVTPGDGLGTGKPEPKPEPDLRKETSSPKEPGDGGMGDAAAPGQVPRAESADVPNSPGAWAVLFWHEFGVEVSPTDIHARKKFWPIATAWVQAGVSVGQMRAAVDRARTEATETIAYLPAYVDRVLASSCSAVVHESRAESAARARMQEAAPLAASRGPAPLHPPAGGEGYAYFEQAAARVPALEEVQ
jgi:hypothetical protein